jgi:hypothetical protein
MCIIKHYLLTLLNLIYDEKTLHFDEFGFSVIRGM